MDLVTIAYNTNGVVLGAAFIPQIISLIRNPAASKSMNLLTWALFSTCALITLLYSMFHNGDGYFVFCSEIGVLGNISVLLLGILRRFQRLDQQ
jgi:lipid-A-disaccharide synthase-like uncharacterized protein